MSKFSCPDCNGNPDDAADACCPTCEDSHSYDNAPDWCDDTRRDAWEGDDEWSVSDDCDDDSDDDGCFNDYADLLGDDDDDDDFEDWCDYDSL